MTSFFSALTYPFRGVAHIARRPALWKYFAAAVAVNLVLFAVLIALFVHYRAGLVAWITPAKFPDWLRATLGWILTGVVAIAGLFLFTVVGNIIAAPFLDAMTERMLRDLGETLPPSRGVARALLRALVNQSLKLLFFGALQGLLLLLLVTPVAFLHPPLSGLLAVLFLGFEYIDYPLDARRVGVPGRFAWLGRRLPAALGFGLVLFGVLWIPFLGYLCLPLAVAGAALLVHNIDSPGPTV
jgi:CysZ protein